MEKWEFQHELQKLQKRVTKLEEILHEKLSPSQAPTVVPPPESIPPPPNVPEFGLKMMGLRIPKK